MRTENLKMDEVKSVTEVAEKIRGLMNYAITERQNYGYQLAVTHEVSANFGFMSKEYDRASTEAKRMRERAESLEDEIKTLMWVLGVKPQIV